MVIQNTFANLKLLEALYTNNPAESAENIENVNAVIRTVQKRSPLYSIIKLGSISVCRTCLRLPVKSYF